MSSHPTPKLQEESSAKLPALALLTNLGWSFLSACKDMNGNTLDWDKANANASIRTLLIPKSYLEIERAATEMWDESTQRDIK